MAADGEGLGLASTASSTGVPSMHGSTKHACQPGRAEREGWKLSLFVRCGDGGGACDCGEKRKKTETGKRQGWDKQIKRLY